ncbi:MAG: DUF58 domain-containing protein [Thainema sp.]
MIPAARLYWFLLLSGAIATAVSVFVESSLRLQFGIVVLLFIDSILLLLSWWDSVQVRSQRVEVQRQPLQRLSIGRDNKIELTIKTAQQPATLEIYDLYPAEFHVSAMPLRVIVPANATETVTFTVFPDHRGEYQWGDIQVRQLGAWGLGWHAWTVPQAQTVAVYPDLIGLRSLTIKLAIQSTGSIRQAKRLGVGTEFTELREYAIGDDPRFIDWKATARRSQPLIRVLEPEQEQTLIILLDRGRLMTAKVKEISRFDWGLNATLSLALAGLHRGDRVGVGVFDRQLHTWIPPTRGQQHLPKLIERLTPIQPELVESDYLSAVTTVVNQQHRRALVVILTDLVDKTASAELLSALVRLRPRYLPFCVTLRDPQVDVRAHELTDEIEATYTRAVALDLIAQRQLVFQQLKRKGVMVLDAPADRITDELVESYLRIKSRSRL